MVPTNAFLHHVAGLSALAMARPQAAVEHLEIALASMPQHAVLPAAAMAAAAQDGQAAAIAATLQAERETPGTPTVQPAAAFGEALARCALGERAAAVGALQAA